MEEYKKNVTNSLRKSVTFTVQTTVNLSDDEFMAEILNAEQRINTRSKLRFHLHESDYSFEDIKKKIGGYKFICRLAKVPQFMIDFPEIFNHVEVTEKDIEWAKKAIKEYEDSKKKK